MYVRSAIYEYMLGCAVFLCLVVCLTLLASFFLPSHLSLRYVSYSYMYVRSAKINAYIRIYHYSTIIITSTVDTAMGRNTVLVC